MSMLRLSGLTKRYGALTVVDDISLSVEADTALGILGPNGAGKTTLFNLVAGTVAADGGRIEFQGVDVTNMSAAERCRRGIARSFQIPHPFAGMTVFENILVGAAFGRRVSQRDAFGAAVDAMETTGLAAKANVVAGALTLLERKRLEMARALATGPTLLLLDEIAGGLTEHECQDLIAAIEKVRSTGVTIIWIEHVVHALMAVVDRLIAIDFGKEIAQGTPKAVIEDPRVTEIYMGIAADA